VSSWPLYAWTSKAGASKNVETFVFLCRFHTQREVLCKVCKRLRPQIKLYECLLGRLKLCFQSLGRWPSHSRPAVVAHRSWWWQYRAGQKYRRSCKDIRGATVKIHWNVLPLYLRGGTAFIGDGFWLCSNDNTCSVTKVHALNPRSRFCKWTHSQR